MIDREKVIKGLEICRHRAIRQENCKECPYIYDGRSKQSNCEGVLHWDALALLKEQKPVKPVLEQGSMVCGDCGHDVIIQRFIGGEVFDEKVSFCPACGSAVNWEIND